MQRGKNACLETAKRLPSFIFEAWKFPNQKKNISLLFVGLYFFSVM